MIKYFKKIFYKKKLAGITICFLSAIFMIPILSVSALGEVINPYFERPLNDNIFTTFKPSYIYNEYYNELKNYYENYYQIEYPYYLIFGADSDTANRKPMILIFQNQNDLEKLEVYISANYGTKVGFNFILNPNSNGMKCEFRVISGNEQIVCDNNIYSLETNFGYCSTKNGCQEGVDSLNNLFDTNMSIPITLGIRNSSPNATNYLTFNYKDVLYNYGDIIVNDLSKIGSDVEHPDYISARKLYNFQIDLENQSHLEYTHSLRFNYGDYQQNPIFKGFKFIGLTNNNGLYHWEETNKCYINNNDYQVVSNNDYFEISVSNIKGDCLDYYDKIRLIVNLDNLMIKDIPNIQGDSNSMGYFNFLSHSSVVDVFSNYKYVNFTTNKNNVKFDLLVKESFDGKFENRHFFKYFDKNELKTTDEYVNNHIGPYPVYNNMYKLHNVILDKTKGLTVFKMDVMENEIFIFEYKNIYYSLTNNDFNKNVKIIDEEGTPQEVDIDVEYPDPPSENITDINVGVGSLKDGISVVHTLYSTFYNNLTVEFKILHNLFFTLLIISIVIKVVLKWLKLLIILVKL